MEGGRRTFADELTDQFYAWEQRGRGWQLWPQPVVLEPAFAPFLFHAPSRLEPVPDDGRTHTWLSSMVAGLVGTQNSAARHEPQDPEFLFEPERWQAVSPLIEVQLSIPPDMDTDRETTEQLLVSLAYAWHPLSFEILGLADATLVQLTCREEDLPQLEQQVRAHFPDIVLTTQPDLLRRHWLARPSQAVVVDFGLSHEFMRPLRIYKKLEVDPLIGIVGAMADLHEGELALFQVLFQATGYPWAESILRAVMDEDGKPFFTNGGELVALAKEKVSSPLFSTVIRVAARSPSKDRAWHIVRALGSGLKRFASPTSNELIPLTNEGYSDKAHAEDVLCRRSHRSGMLLNSEELVSLVHPPSSSVRSTKLKRESRKTKAAPASTAGHQLILGTNTHAGRTSVVSLSPEHRLRHTYLIGTSGTGKSTLLLNLIIQDIKNGEGIGVLDPHGDLIDQILGYIPESRHDDVVLIDAADADHPVGLNILSAHTELEKNLIASDLVAVFKRLSTSWGDQMTSVLGNAILAFLESQDGGTLVDLRRLLVEPAFRNHFLKTVQDPEVVYYWQHEFPLLAGKPQGPILTRLDTFLRPKTIRYMVAQRKDRLALGAMMNEGKIVLAKLAQGAIGEENAYLLGALLVTKFHQLALARQDLPQAKRRPFFLYIDEFHHFVTPSMASILSGARKYGLGLVLAHQELRQLSQSDEAVFSAVISNPCTRICFRLGDLDAKKLADGFASFDAKDLQNLGVGEALCRVERSDNDFNLSTPPLPPMDQVTAERRRERLVALSRRKYASRKEEVEALLRREPSAQVVAPAMARHKALPIPAKPPPVVEPVSAGPVIEVPAPAEDVDTAAAPQPAPTKKAPLRESAPSPGRGGQQHKYLQQLIKRWAEDRGYRAAVEKTILDGIGSVDVSLEREGSPSIACEITVTTPTEHEVGNLQKCLAAGYEYVLAVSTQRRVLTRLREAAAAALPAPELARLRFCTPEELFAFVDELDARPQDKDETVRGYKVKVRFKSEAADEHNTRRQVISQVLLKTMRKLDKDAT